MRWLPQPVSIVRGINVSNHPVGSQCSNKHTEKIVKPKIPYVMAVYLKKLLGWLIAYEIVSFKLAERISRWWGLRNV